MRIKIKCLYKNDHDPLATNIMQLTPKKISIITVCYNAEQAIGKAIQSVLLQSYQHIEYIIIDGQSQDSTMQIVQKYADKITKIISEPDSGIYDAMNKGINYASGDILYFLNADDRLYNHDVIMHIMSQFANNDKVELVFGRLQFENVPRKHQVIVDELQSATYKNRRDILTHIPPQQAIFARRKVFEQVGKFDTNYVLGADTDWFLRCIKNKILMKFIDKKIAYFNSQGLSYTQKGKAIQERIKAVRSNSSFIDFWFYFVPVRSWLAVMFYCINLIKSTRQNS